MTVVVPGTSLHQRWQPHLHPCFLYNSKMVPSITPDYHQHANVLWSLLDSLFAKEKILSKLLNKKVGNEKVILKMNLIHCGWEPDEHLFYAVQLRLKLTMAGRENLNKTGRCEASIYWTSKDTLGMSIKVFPLLSWQKSKRFSHARNVQLGLEESGCCPDYTPNLLGKSFWY